MSKRAGCADRARWSPRSRAAGPAQGGTRAEGGEGGFGKGGNAGEEVRVGRPVQRAMHLDSHIASVSQLAAVDLPERGGGHRRGPDGPKDGGEIAKLRAHDLEGSFVGPGRERLARLDDGRAERRQQLSQLHGAPRPVGLLSAHLQVDHHPADEADERGDERELAARHLERSGREARGRPHRLVLHRGQTRRRAGGHHAVNLVARVLQPLARPR
eukprot:scaffold31476_cov121-Isochrysis_galbana.AAC.4